MKYVWTVVLVITAVGMPHRANAQVQVYGGFSDVKMTNLATSYTIPGFTVGVNIDGPRLFRRLQIAADIQARLLNRSSVKLNTAAFGPRATLNLAHGWAPYGAVLVGFGRYYTNGTNGDAPITTTDSVLQLNAGIAKRITPRFDLYGEYGYSQFYANGGEYNPKVFSGGAIFHFAKR